MTSLNQENAPIPGVFEMSFRTAKQAEAARRMLARNARSDREQLDRLLARGAGSCKEAIRLFERLNPTVEQEQELADIEPPKRNRPARKRRARPASLM